VAADRRVGSIVYDLVKCQELVSAIDEAARRTDACRQQRQWTNPAGGAVYDSAVAGASWVTAEYLSELPKRSGFFTGWAQRADDPRLGFVALAVARGLAIASPAFASKTLSWLAARTDLGGLAAARLGPPPELFASLLKSYARGLPYEYRCPPDFDGTDFDKLAVQERMHILWRSRLLERLRAKASPVVIEIGAGYGALAAAIKRIVPQATYVIVDLPHSLYASACYLASRQSAPVKVLRGAPAEISPGSFLMTVTTLAGAIPDVGIDLAVNTLSFAEMPGAVVDAYARLIRSRLSPGGALFEQNFDCAHVGRENFCDPASVLKRHFGRVDKIRGMYLKGTPRIWRPSPTS
jgi:hypothetical protein